MVLKKRVGIVFGGKNLEHEVSVRSAVNVMQALDQSLFDLQAIGIDKEGFWHVVDLDKLLKIYKVNDYISLSDHKEIFLKEVDFTQLRNQVDIVFPVLHGKIGEDGCVQGFFRTLEVPFVGSDVMSSSICMDKEIVKRLLDFEKIPSSRYLIYTNPDEVCLEEIIKTLDLPVFVKPSNSGSSVGISKAKTKEELKASIDMAFDFDHKIVIEEMIEGLEIECSVLGNENPKASLPARIIPSHEFYSYEAKYIDPNGASFENPAQIDPRDIEKIQELAIKTYKSLRCSGLARVDFFLAGSGRVYINEINTMPGFTNISMYPQMWEVAGLPYKDLITELLELGLKKNAKDSRLLDNVENAECEKLPC